MATRPIGAGAADSKIPFHRPCLQDELVPSGRGAIEETEVPGHCEPQFVCRHSRSNNICPAQSMRMKQSTPTARRVSSGRSDPLQPPNSARRMKDQCQLQSSGLDRGRRTRVNSVDSARAACEGPTSTPQRQHSLVGDLRESESSFRSDPGKQGSCPQVSMVGTLGKAKQCDNYCRSETPA